MVVEHVEAALRTGEHLRARQVHARDREALDRGPGGRAGGLLQGDDGLALLPLPHQQGGAVLGDRQVHAGNVPTAGRRLLVQAGRSGPRGLRAGLLGGLHDAGVRPHGDQPAVGGRRQVVVALLGDRGDVLGLGEGRRAGLEGGHFQPVVVVVVGALGPPDQTHRAVAERDELGVVPAGCPARSAERANGCCLAVRIRVERESPSPVRETRAPFPAATKAFSPPEAEAGVGFGACRVRVPHGPGARVSTAAVAVAVAVVPVAAPTAAAVVWAAAGAAAARARTGVSTMPSTARDCEVMGMPPGRGVSGDPDSPYCSNKFGAAYISQDRLAQRISPAQRSTTGVIGEAGTCALTPLGTGWTCATTLE